jgi:hypothetical protein
VTSGKSLGSLPHCTSNCVDKRKLRTGRIAPKTAWTDGIGALHLCTFAHFHAWMNGTHTAKSGTSEIVAEEKRAWTKDLPRKEGREEIPRTSRPLSSCARRCLDPDSSSSCVKRSQDTQQRLLLAASGPSRRNFPTGLLAQSLSCRPTITLGIRAWSGRSSRWAQRGN